MKRLPTDLHLSDTGTRRLRRFFDRLDVNEQLAMLVGVHVGKGLDFPTDEDLRVLRRQLQGNQPKSCRRCKAPLPTRPPGRNGRWVTYCDTCRSKLGLVKT